MYGARAPHISASTVQASCSGSVPMKRLLVIRAATGIAGVLMFCSPLVAQIPPPQKRAEHVEIIKGPALEISHDDLAIIRWTTTNPAGDDDHYAVIHYGTDPNDLSLTTKNHIRLNRGHPETTFRVRVMGLQPQTTYYYKVTSMGGDGQSDGVESAVNHFTTAAAGQVTSAFPPPQ
jgi:phosphodiesterase/alkaline phosphatase D-like protein